MPRITLDDEMVERLDDALVSLGYSEETVDSVNTVQSKIGLLLDRIDHLDLDDSDT
jgi:hypothetical protein